MLAQILACPQETLVLVYDVVFACVLISEKIDSFLETSNLSRHQKQNEQPAAVILSKRQEQEPAEDGQASAGGRGLLRKWRRT